MKYTPGWMFVGLILFASSLPQDAISQDSEANPSPARSAQFFEPNEHLAAEGIPKIPLSLAAAAARFNDYRDALLQSWHPTRREMLVLTRFGDTRQVHTVKAPGGARTQLTFYPDQITEAIYPPQGSDSFIFLKDVGGGEFFQIYHYDVPTGDITLLTDGISRNTFPVWSWAGDKLAYGSTRRSGSDVDLYVVEPANPKSDHMIAQLQGGGWQVLDWSPDGRELLVREEISINESYLWIFDVDGGQKKLVIPKGGTMKVSYQGGKFAKDGEAIYVTTDRDSEFMRLTRIDLETERHWYMTSDIPWDIRDFALSRDGKTLAFVANEDGIGKLHLLETYEGKGLPVPKLPLGSVGALRWHSNNEDLGFELTSTSAPTDSYSVNVKTGQVERWTYSETGGVKTSGFREPELIHWKSFDGRTISGFLYLPPARFTGKRPVIINIHGGPESQFRPGFLGRNNYFINELGIAMVFPNVRGSAGYGKTFLTLDNGFLREGSYKDIGSLIDWIGTRPDLDPKRILITGGSYGGFMTLAVATNFNDRICCSVDVVGPSNLVTFLEHTSGYRRDLRRVEYGDERDPKMRAFLEQIAPSNKAKNITKPLFVIQGKNDPRVPASESEQMVATVRNNGAPVWFLMADDEGHGFRKKQNQDFQFFATVMFVERYLLGATGIKP